MRLLRGLRGIFVASVFGFGIGGCVAQDLKPLPVEEHDDHGAPAELVMGDTLSESFESEDGWLVSPPLEAPEGATRVALMIDLRGERPEGELVIEARGLSLESAAEWVPAEIVWSEDLYIVARAELGFVADAIQVRVPEGHDELLEGLRYEAVIPEDMGEGPLVEAPGAAEQGLASDFQNIGVISRGSWGARRTRCTSQNATKTRIAVHHTVTAPTLNGNYAARVRQIQAFHMDGRGWCDVGYHFLVTLDGRVWEGRPVHLLGSHVGNHNSGNVGVSFVGCFQPGACNGIASASAPEKMIAGGAKVIERIAKRYGIKRDAARVKGHRDHSGASTACPGDNVHKRLGALRSYKAPNNCAKVKRVSGQTRYATAAQFSKNNFNKANRVVLVSGADNNPAAFLGGSLARKVGGSVLLTAKNNLPTATRQELRRLGAQRVLVVGGEGAITTRVERQLSNMGITPVRVGGNNRYQVAAAVAKRVGSPSGVAFVVAGDDPVAAISAGNAAAAMRVPLLYVSREKVPAATAAAIEQLGITKVYVVGAAVPNAVLRQLPSATRIAEGNRYKTSAAVADLARRKGAGTHRVYLTRGDISRNGVLVGATGRLQLLSQSDGIGAAPRDFLKKHAQRVTLLGGTGALDAKVQRAACKALN